MAAVRPDGSVIDLETISDVVALLNPKEVRKRGVTAEVFERNGLPSLDAIAVGLRARGYEIELFEEGGARRIRLIATPGVAAKRRAKDQTQLFDMPRVDQYRFDKDAA